MKRYSIEAILEFETVETRAARRIFNRDDDYTEEELAIYSDFIDTVYSIVASYNFNIKEDRQSNKSYSYYIVFEPTDTNGNPFEGGIKFEIVFRISDHRNSGSRDFLNSKKLVKSYIYDGEHFSNLYDIMVKVDKDCRLAQAGDFSSIVEVDRLQSEIDL